MAILRWIKQYKEWTGDESWEYKPQEFNRVVSERMYRMAVDGHSVSEIASEIHFPKSRVISLVLDYCRRNNLETPLKKRKIVRKKQRIVRQCSVCMNITATYEGSGYETTCQGCTNFPEDSKQRTRKWIARERESAEFTKKNRAIAYDGKILDVSTECGDDVFFEYLKIDFNRRIIKPTGKKPEGMFEIVRDIQKVWELCKPMWSASQIEAIKTKFGIELKPRVMMCPVFSPSLKGPNGISCLLAPLEDWVISVDMVGWWFDIQGELVTFLSMDFSDWLRHQYVEKEMTIEEIAEEVNTTVYRVE
ncbi:MAG: hypothetical protein ACFFER_09350, partial [Candidatus Thorarchaeota archaeon]